MQREKGDQVSAQSQLSKVWQELLNGCSSTEEAGEQGALNEAVIPVIESDPWHALLRSKGIEIVDLQQIRLHMSDQDVEQLLQIIQEKNHKA